uniref:Putative ribose-5-phosphate isomerase 3ic n=1 Tax=Rhizophora mucronata TaxID=61149 RepID=A0A2P2JEF8_RHIMU
MMIRRGPQMCIQELRLECNFAQFSKHEIIPYFSQLFFAVPFLSNEHILYRNHQAREHNKISIK